MNPYPGVLLLIPDDARSSSLRKELDAVLGDRNTKDAPNEIEYRLSGVDDFDTGKIDVLGRTTRIERGQQHATLEDEAVA
jgi:hypothetical protein